MPLLLHLCAPLSRAAAVSDRRPVTHSAAIAPRQVYGLVCDFAMEELRKLHDAASSGSSSRFACVHGLGAITLRMRPC